VILIMLLALLILALVSPLFLLGSVPLALGAGSQDRFGIPIGAISLLAYFLHGVYYFIVVSLMLAIVVLMLVRHFKGLFHNLDHPFLLLRFKLDPHNCMPWAGSWSEGRSVRPEPRSWP